MKQSGFNNLSLVDKARTVAEYGKFLISLDQYENLIHLYALNNEFVEVYHDIWTRRIFRITLATYKDLDKYVDRIYIPNLKVSK